MSFILPCNYNRLSVSQRREVRFQYVEVQKGLCQQCKHPLKDPPIDKGLTINKALFPDGFFNNPVHLHHDHNTGLTIGAVHAECNAIAWQYFGE